MKPENAEQILNKINERKDSSHTILAHASARYVLYNVNEPKEGHPTFLNNLNFRIDNLAISFLEIGCSFAEGQDFEKAKDSLTSGALLIELNHLPEQNRNEYSNYYILIAALAYYAASEYSKAFIILKRIEQDTDLSLLISYFFKKDFHSTIKLLNRILLNDNYIISGTTDDFNIDSGISTVLFAKSMANFLEYLFTGNNSFLITTKEIFDDLFEISVINKDPSIWWVIRLLRIIINTIRDNSLWTNLPLKVNPEKSDEPWKLEDDILNRFPFLRENTNEFLLKSYIDNLVQRENPIVELFVSQRKALDKILSDNGTVINLPTSSGKTRIAEIAILQCLIENKFGKVLYVAPFRSLAFEIEKTLNETYAPLNYTVSHLYGGSQFSKLDQSLIDESHILVATPEKAKAILRANDEFTEQIELVIIDEGHLLNTSKRYVTNELFLEELKYYVNRNNGKIILLSAVLPNAEDISEWITGSKDNIVIDEWRPSSQRLGLLEYTGKNVNINWQNPINKERIRTFNYSFIEPFQSIKKIFPSSKQEAIASTAVKLTQIGSVLIFIGGSRNVEKTIFNYAKFVKIAYREKLQEIDWRNIPEWIEFELICNETYGDNSELLDFAKYGIICHHGKFPNIVRLSLDKLLSTKKAQIIICTTTLAQGVNIGVSSVIFANVYVSGHKISNNDFWNIAGRAGRAFIDTEGKILYAIDRTNDKAKYHIKIAREYFEKRNISNIESGFLQYLKAIMNVAKKCNISFDLLLQLITENDFSTFKTSEEDYSAEILDFFDWTDDVLLTFEINNEMNEGWVDTYFRKSLAYIQAQKSDDINEEDIIKILEARRKAILKIVDDSAIRKQFVASGLPLMSIVELDKNFDEIISFTDEYLSSEKDTLNLIEFIRNIEVIISKLPSSSFKKNYSEVELKAIRKDWFSGIKFSETFKNYPNAQKIINQYYGYTIPWVFNAIARKFQYLELEEKANLFEEIAVLSEIGVPNFNAAKIYLAGIKSRIAAVELSNNIKSEIITENNIGRIAKILIKHKTELQSHCHLSETESWLDTLEINRQPLFNSILKISDFTFSDESVKIKSEILFVRNFNDTHFLVSPDFNEKIEVGISEDFPFDKVNNRTDIYFEFTDNKWEMKSRNPKLRIQ